MNSVYLCHALLTHPEYYDIVASRLTDLKWAAKKLTDIGDEELAEQEPSWAVTPKPSSSTPGISRSCRTTRGLWITPSS